MTEVVTGDIRAHRITVGKAQDDLKPAVHRFVLKNRTMDGVVRDDGAKPGPNAGGNEEGHCNPWVGWNGVTHWKIKEKEIEPYKPQGASIGFVSQLKHALALPQLVLYLRPAA